MVICLRISRNVFKNLTKPKINFLDTETETCADPCVERYIMDSSGALGFVVLQSPKAEKRVFYPIIPPQLLQ
jgi:hypothetical protein